MNIELKDKNGITLKTAGKYCSSDVGIIPKLQSKSVATNGSVVADEGYCGLDSVTVDVPATPTEEKTVDLAMASGNQTITPTSGKVLSQVVVKKPATMLPENIKKDVNIGGVTGTLEIGGGGELNIAYGDTAPEDTSKLWIKSEKPSNISFPVVWKPEQIVEGITDTNDIVQADGSTYPYVYASVGTKIYMFGNYYYVRIYNTITKETIKTSIITNGFSFRQQQTVVIGDKIYLGYSNYFYIYDTKTNTLSSRKTITGIGAGDQINVWAVVGTNIYMFGYHKNIFKYDTVSGAVINTGVQYGKDNSSAVAVGEKIYLFGGHLDSSSSSSTDIYRFNTNNNTLTLLSSKMIDAMYDVNAVVVSDEIYIFGGEKSSGTSQKVQMFDVYNETIQDLQITLPNAVLVAVGVVSKAYLFPYTTSGNTHIYQFIINLSLHLGNIIVTRENYSRVFKVMKAPTEVEVGIKYVYKGNSSNNATFIDAYLFDGTNWINVNTGDVYLIKFYAPKIRISNETLFITNDNRNGSKVTSYEIYKDGVLLTTTTNTSFDLSSLISELGTYAITVKAVGADIAKSELSNEAKYICANMTYAANQVEGDTSLTTSVNCQVGDLVVAAIIVGSALTLPDSWTLVSTSNVISGDTTNQTLSFAYKVATSTSESITVTQATSGRIYTTLCALQGAKSITDIGYTYSTTDTKNSLTVNKTAGIKLWAASNPLWSTSAPYGDWTCSADTKYIAVNQASYQPRLGVFYEPNDELTSVTFSGHGNGYITVGGLNISYESYECQITPTLTNVTAASGNATTIATGETKVLTYTANSGYTLPDSVTVTGATGVWNKDAGTLTLSNPTGNVTFTIAGVEVAAAGYNVTVSGDGSNHGFDIYDGQSASGTKLGTINNSESINVVCTSGYLYFSTSDGGGIISVTGGVTEVDWNTVKVTGDGTVTASYSCLIEGTQITLANGSTKAIEDITYDDELLVWNFYDGKFDKAKPSWIKVEETAPRYNLVKFSNGSEVGFVGAGGEKGYHRIFNKEAGAFTHTGCKDTPNGATTFAQDGTFPTVVSQEVVEKEVKFYNVITDKHYNLFANGILTSCRLSNKYRIEDMKYVGEKLISDEQEKAYFERIGNKRK